MLAIGLFLILIPCTIAAWLIFFLCWWGKLAQTPASCAKCGHATGDRVSSLATNCPECGADLSDTRAIRYFQRERTPSMKVGLVASSIVMLGATGLPVLSSVLLFMGLFRQTAANSPSIPSTTTLMFAVVSVINLLLFVLGPACIGYGIAILIRGRSDPHAPICGNCKAPLSRDTLATTDSPAHACLSCGTTPIVVSAQRSRAVVRGILFIVLAIVLWIALIGIFAVVMITAND